MGGNIVVLSFTHPHFVLQDFCHRSDTFAVTVGGDFVHIFGQQVVVFLFRKVPLTVHQFVRGVQVLGLQVLPGVFVGESYIFGINPGFPQLPEELYQWFDGPEWNQFFALSVKAEYMKFPVRLSDGR